MKNIIYFFLFFCFAAKAQNNALVQIWTNQNGNQSGSFKNFTIQDKFGATYVAGAHKNNAATHDGYISKLSAQGQTIWTYNYTGTGNGDDVVLSVKFDNYKNIYLTGTTYKSATNNYDLFLVKLDKDGNLLWSETYNGTASSMDSGGDIVLDTLGNIFVVGASMNSGTLVDFVVLKYDSIGNQVWENQYDYANFNDAANKVILIGDSIYISGVSQSAPNNWDFTTITVSAIDGNIGNAVRSGGSGNGIDKLNAITYDNNGNIYLTGAVLNANNNYDARTIKLNPNLSIVWSKDYNGIDNLDDESNDVKVDSIGNVYIAGYSTKTGESKNILLIKYNSSGDTIFTKLQNGLGNGHDQANAVCLGLDGSIFITGSSKNSNEDIVTIKFNSYGFPIKTQSYSGTGNGRANSVSIGELGEIIISGQIFENGDYKNVTINYLENIELPDISSNQILNTGSLKYIEDLLLVRFHPACFKMDIMDNKKIRHQKLGNILKDTIIQILTNKFYGNLNEENIKVIAEIPSTKPFYFLDSDDTTSVSRNAQIIKIPQFWATVLLYLPAELNFKEMCDSLNRCEPFVRFIDVIPIPNLYSVPNDYYYQSKQKSLHFDSNYPNADINVEEAWDIETGKKFVRVGVLDTPADTLHADLSLAGKYNFYSANDEISPGQMHGTRVAGIIGAKRNNSIGVAGIAGGNGNDSTGVKLFSLDVLGAFQVTPAHIAYALVMGSSQQADPIVLGTQIPGYGLYFAESDTGLGLNIINHSYGVNYGTFVPVNPKEIYIPGCIICQEALEYSYRNGVINVAARGNEFDGAPDTETDSIFPSCVKDEMIISVTASGYDGLFKSYSNNNPDTASSEDYMSMYGRNVDIMAPGTTANVYTTEVNYTSPDLYYYFNGTSASSPHVAGTAALMLSHVNRPCPCEKNLAQEDVEYILQKNASERNTTIVNGNSISTPGYDKYNGWGMLDAGKALKAIEEPKNQIIHVNKEPLSRTSTLVAEDVIVQLYNPYSILGPNTEGPFYQMFDLNGLLANTSNYSRINKKYLVDIYKVEAAFNHSDKTQHLSSSTEIKDYWTRNSNSRGWLLDSCIHIGTDLICDSIDVSQNVYFDSTSLDINQANLYTFVYHFKELYPVDTSNNPSLVNQWYPCRPENTKFSYSIYVYDSLATSVPYYPCGFYLGHKEQSDFSQNYFKIFPNPTNDKLNISSEFDNTVNLDVLITDISGRKIYNLHKGTIEGGKHFMAIDVKEMNQGLYIVQLFDNENLISTKKFVKN
ncbi:MAG TPA: S8 family serine peptidase [Bacteroidia bacterium]|nr:S8 family serine peptidase [Bacteroidia bacterium]